MLSFLRHTGQDGAESGDAGTGQPRPFSSPDVEGEGTVQRPVRARVLASRGSLRSTRDLQSPQPLRTPHDPLFTDLPVADTVEQGARGGLAPNLDQELDQAHRFALLGRLFRPIKNFFRRALGTSLRSGNSKGSSSDPS